jgi:hypothetical protein
MPKLRGTAGVLESRAFEDSAVDGANHFSEGDLCGRSREKIAADLSAYTAGDTSGFKFQQDLDQVLGWDSLFCRELINAHRATSRVRPGKPENSPGSIVAFK